MPFYPVGGGRRKGFFPRTRFDSLDDTPNSYVGHAGEMVVVNGTENGLTFQAIAPDDHKVLGDAADPTAGYLDAKVDNVTIEVNASHQLQVKSGGVSLDSLSDVTISAPAADQILAYNGSEWVNEALVIPSGGGAGVQFYLDDTASGVSTYDSLFTYPAGGAEDVDTVNLNNASGEVLLDDYISTAINRTSLEGGQWVFNTYGSVSNVSGLSEIIIRVYIRTAVGVETEIFNVSTGEINSTTAALFRTATVQAAQTGLNTTDRVLIKYYAKTTSAALLNVSLYHNGTAHYSNIQTPFVILHNNLPGIQGGAANDYNHITTTEKGYITSHASRHALGGADQITLWPSYFFLADQMEYPSSADWAVNSLAPVAPDSDNAGISVRKFDDTTVEGVGFSIFIPSGVTNLTFSMKSRAETAPAAGKVVKLNLYNRQIPDNAAVGAWSAATALTDISIPTNEYFQYDSETISLVTLGITAGRFVQFELTRFSTDGGDTLAGDWNLLDIRVTLS